nr:MAG TPA: anaerobic ribonucleoside triphosphate reductase [Bacteriophage sp.]
MTRLTPEQIQSKVNFVRDYIKASNAANGSALDANANVSNKNIATLSAELNKDINIQLNRAMIKERITKRFGPELADEYERQLEAHEIYTHDETSILPYCASITMYPFLTDGLKAFGGETKAPKHLSSFNGGLINLVFAVSSQLAGANAIVEYLMYFDYFARKDYGDDYLETHPIQIAQEFQQFIYAINQPAAARGFQSAFTNISIYDRPYFEAIFGDFVFPDFTKPSYNSLSKLQKFFMHWFNEERKQALLTFPVVTAACLNDGTTLKDKDFQDFITKEYSEGNAFFTYTSSSADALSSCCRLKNDISSQKEFSYSLGAGGVATGSKNVITININRLIQDNRDIVEEVRKVHKYQLAFEDLYQDYFKSNMMPLYSGGFISLDKQYLTIGINGVVEAAEYLGYEISNNQPYKDWVSSLLKKIYDENRKATKEYGVKFNTEFVPAENLGAKHALWDKADGYRVPRDCYNSYLYKVEDNEISVLDKFALHGKQTTQFLDGGSAYHCNLESYPTQEGFKKLIDVAVKEGCEYFCFNVLITGCEDCGHIDKQTLQQCPKCKSKNIWHATRVIGYLKKISDFSTARQNEASLRYYAKSTK